LSASLAREKALKAKLNANSKALKDAQTRLVTVEANSKKDVAAAEAKATKAEKSLAEVRQKQTKREQVVVELVDSLSMKFGRTYNFPIQVSLFSIVGALC
jgi:septal ring factor EnvC (AmiA/AmiB activator)